MKDLGVLKYFLGIPIERYQTTGVLNMNQKQFASKIVESFNMVDYNGISVYKPRFKFQ